MLSRKAAMKSKCRRKPTCLSLAPATTAGTPASQLCNHHLHHHHHHHLQHVLTARCAHSSCVGNDTCLHPNVLVLSAATAKSQFEGHFLHDHLLDKFFWLHSYTALQFCDKTDWEDVTCYKAQPSQNKQHCAYLGYLNFLILFAFH